MAESTLQDAEWMQVNYFLWLGFIASGLWGLAGLGLKQ